MNQTVNYLKNSVLSPNYKKPKESDNEESDTSQEVKKQVSKEVSKPARKLRSKEVKNEANITVDFESSREIEKLVKYGTYLRPSLVKKIKIYAAISEKDQQDIIGEILEREMNKLFKQDGLIK